MALNAQEKAWLERREKYPKLYTASIGAVTEAITPVGDGFGSD